MAEANKTALAHFPETAMWRLLKTTNTAVVEPQKQFSGAKAPTILYESGVQVTAKHDFGETFDQEKFYVKFVGKVELHNLFNSLCKLQYHYVF